MATRDDIIRELLAGAAPYPLSKKYPKSSVYEIRKELERSGQLPEPGTIVIDEGGREPQPFIPATPAPPIAVEEKKREAGAETVELGPKTLPFNAVERIRGILGLTLRPKVLSCPMPELLYPAMVISVTELGFKPMRPDDFIDTVLYQWLEACDYIPYAYMKRSELEEYAKTYGVTGENISEYIRKHNLMTPKQFAEKFGIVLEEEPQVEGGEASEAAVEELKEEIEIMKEEAEQEAKETGDEPRKPTVGDLLKRLHISNISKEVENGSAGCPEPSSS